MKRVLIWFRNIPRGWKILISIPVGFVILVSLLVLLFGDYWKAQAIALVNEQLAGELEVSEMELSWWGSFPNVSVDLRDVALITPNQDTIAVAEHVGLELDFWSLFGGTPELGRVLLERGQMNIQQDDQGKWNVLQLLAEPEDGSPSTTSLTVEEIACRDMDVEWSVGSMVSGTMHIIEGTCFVPSSPGEFGWDISSSECLVTGKDIPMIVPASMSSRGSWRDHRTSDWTTEGSLTFGGISSSWELMSDSLLGWKGAIAIPHLSQTLLESVLMEPLLGNSSSLHNDFSLNIQLQPEVMEVEWDADRGSFHLPQELSGLSQPIDGSWEGQGTLRQENNQWEWMVDQGVVKGEGWEIRGGLRPLSDSRIQWDGTAHLDASEGFIERWSDWSEEVKSDLPKKGKIHGTGQLIVDLENGIQDLSFSLRLESLQGQFDGHPYLIEADDLLIDNTHLNSDSIHIEWAGNDAKVNIRQLPWNSILAGGPVTGDIEMHARSFFVTPILSWWYALESEEATIAELLPYGSSLGLRLETNQLEWDGLQCTDVVASTKVTHNRWNITSAQAKGLEGGAHVEGSLSPGRAGWQLTLRGSADDISLPMLFATYDNFGQTLVRHDHLSGAMSMAGNLGMSWGLDGSWHGEHFTASLQTSINHGRLRELEVFDEIADYLSGHRLMAPLVDPEDLRTRLRDVEFDPVSQLIDVRGEQVRLPMTVIKSSAMNVAIEGVYGFDDNIDYTLGFALRDLRSSASDAFGEMTDDGLGNQFFLRMAGPVEEPEYSYNREAAKDHRRAAIQAEKNRILDAFKNKNNPQEQVTESPVLVPAEDPDVAPSQTPDIDAGKTEKPSLFNRGKKPREKGSDDLFNPDDEDYL